MLAPRACLNPDRRIEPPCTSSHRSSRSAIWTQRWRFTPGWDSQRMSTPARARQEGMGLLARRDSVELHLGTVPPGRIASPATAYLHVEDADSLAAEWRKAGTDVGAPEDIPVIVNGGPWVCPRSRFGDAPSGRSDSGSVALLRKHLFGENAPSRWAGSFETPSLLSPSLTRRDRR
jgi:hypothetical protein